MNPLKKKNKIEISVTLDAHLPLKPCFLLPSPLSSVTQQIYEGTEGFASQNFVCKSFPHLKGIKSFSVSTLYHGSCQVTCFEQTAACCLCKSLNNYGQLPTTGTLTRSGIQCPSQTENSSCSMIAGTTSL